MMFECWICIAGAGVFGMPLELENGPPPQLPALSRYEPPSFPDSLRPTSIGDGYATMMFTIGEDGWVEDSVAIEASHPAFVEAMRQAFAQWRFKSAPSATTPRREFIQFDFRRSGIVSSLSHRDASKSFFPQTPAEHERPIRTVDWDGIAIPPERVAGTMPTYPQALRQQALQGVAIISFVIDTEGRVRVPVSLAASERLFADAALSAVKGWRFAPPKHDGVPVNVRVERTFSFGSRKSP